MRKPTYTSREDANRAGVTWRKSSHSFPSGECVEVAQPSYGTVLFDDSKRHNGAVVEVSAAAVRTFVAAVKQGSL
ncbi:MULTISPECIES: DUF397 domain-containing protein [unclassified Streptomyces]|uniref:DUF397 domain-containing protein n=1 Tax=unclassified Streptomyces TaxID=2593676 RepID=UPI003325F393